MDNFSQNYSPPAPRRRRRGIALTGAIFVVASLTLSACHDKELVEDKTPFGDGIVRLGDVPVAEVDGTKIYLSDVERAAVAKGQIEAGTPLTPGTPLFSQTLDGLIDQRLLALAALRQALDQRDETRRRLTLSRERILSSVLVETHLAATVTDETVRRMYDEQAELRARGYEVRARHILTADMAAVEAAKARIEAGEDFATVAREVSIDRASREQGGDLGFFSNDVYDPVFTEIVYDTEIGAMSEPFQTEEGWHIVRVEATRKPAVPKFEDMRGEIEVFMTYDEIQTLLQSMRTEGDVKLITGQSGERSADPASSESSSDEAQP